MGFGLGMTLSDNIFIFNRTKLLAIRQYLTNFHANISIKKFVKSYLDIFGIDIDTCAEAAAAAALICQYLVV